MVGWAVCSQDPNLQHPARLAVAACLDEASDNADNGCAIEGAEPLPQNAPVPVGAVSHAISGGAGSAPAYLHYGLSIPHVERRLTQLVTVKTSRA